MVGERLFEAALNGQLDGQRLGNVLYQMLPALPHEGLPIPRLFLSRGVPGQVAPAPVVLQPVAQVVPAPAVVIPPPAARASWQPAPRASIPTMNEFSSRRARTVFRPVRQLPGL